MSAPRPAGVEPSIDPSPGDGFPGPTFGGGAGDGWDPPATTDPRRCAAPGCDELVSAAATTCSPRCRQRLKRHRDRDYVLTEEDHAAVQRVMADDVCPLPPVTDEERRLLLEAAQPRVPAFTGQPVPEADLAMDPGGDPSHRLNALYARLGRRPIRVQR